MRKKAVQFMKEKGWLEVTKENTRWTNSQILVLQNPEDMSIGKDEYGLNKYLKPGKYLYENKLFIPVAKEDNFPDINELVKKLEEKDYCEAQIEKELGYLKLFKFLDKREEFAVRFTDGKKKVFINYEYYSYLADDKHVWKVDNWKIKNKEDAVMAYCGDILFAIVMPLNLDKGEKDVR